MVVEDINTDVSSKITARLNVASSKMEATVVVVAVAADLVVVPTLVKLEAGDKSKTS